MKTYSDLSDELRAVAPEVADENRRSDFRRLVNDIVEAMQEAFKIGKGYGFREGTQAASAQEKLDAARAEGRAKAFQECQALLDDLHKQVDTLRQQRADADAQLRETQRALEDAKEALFEQEESETVELLQTLVAAVVNEFPRDPSAPSILISWLQRDQLWYASIVRYARAFGEGKTVVVNVKAASVGEALKRLAKAWIGDPEPKKKLQRLIGGGR